MWPQNRAKFIEGLLKAQYCTKNIGVLKIIQLEIIHCELKFTNSEIKIHAWFVYSTFLAYSYSCGLITLIVFQVHCSRDIAKTSLVLNI